MSDSPARRPLRRFLRSTLRPSVGLLAVGLLILGLPWPAANSMVFRPLAEARPGAVGVWASPRFRFGIKVPNPAQEYPSSLAAILNGVSCSATLVGPDALLTSGHCVKVAATSGATIKIKTKNEETTGVCSAFGYELEKDLGLCRLTKELSPRPYETLARDPTLVAKDRTVRLTGWAEPESGFFALRWWHRLQQRLGLNDFRTGTGKVVLSDRLLSIDGDAGEGGDVVIEMGDSGGAGFAEAGSKRLVIGVNQCGGDLCGENAAKDTSRLVNVTAPDAMTWIEDWATGKVTQKPAKVCGYTLTDGCRRQRSSDTEEQENE